MSAATPTNTQSPVAASPSNAQSDTTNQAASAIDRIILEYLKTRGHTAAENALRDELTQSLSEDKGKQKETSADEFIQSLAVFAQKTKSGENALKDSSTVAQELGTVGNTANLQNLISSIAVGAEEILSQDPTDKHEGFRDLQAWVDGSLDMYRVRDTTTSCGKSSSN
jgi:transcription initiation factor TFIID subunit 5